MSSGVSLCSFIARQILTALSLPGEKSCPVVWCDISGYFCNCLPDVSRVAGVGDVF